MFCNKNETIIYPFTHNNLIHKPTNYESLKSISIIFCILHTFDMCRMYICIYKYMRKMRLHSSPGICILFENIPPQHIYIGNLSNSIPGKMREFDIEKVYSGWFKSSYLHFLRDIFRIC